MTPRPSWARPASLGLSFHDPQRECQQRSGSAKTAFMPQSLQRKHIGNVPMKTNKFASSFCFTMPFRVGQTTKTLQVLKKWFSLYFKGMFGYKYCIVYSFQ